MSRALRHARDATSAEPARPQKAAGGLYKTAAMKVLEAEQRFMRSGEITKVAQQMGFFKECTGKTPEHTMASCLYQEIKKGKKSPIVRPKEGLFGLRGWEFVDGDEELPAPRKPRRATSTSASGESEEDDVYVPKGTTARTKKRSVNEFTQDGKPAGEPLVWRSSRTRKKRRTDSDVDDDGEMYENDSEVLQEQMFHLAVDLLLEAAAQDKLDDLSVEKHVADSVVNSSCRPANSSDLGSVDEVGTSAGGRVIDEAPSTSEPAYAFAGSRTCEAQLKKAAKVQYPPPNSIGLQTSGKPVPTTAIPIVAPPTPCVSDDTMHASSLQSTSCGESFPHELVKHTDSWNNTMTLLQTQPMKLKRSGSVSLSVELPFPDQENVQNLSTVPPPLTPELFCRSLSTGSIPTAPVQQTLTQPLTQTFSGRDISQSNLQGVLFPHIRV
eukprot:CAMPEP_0198211656 /NCGR_PEP_ID=MMETSP1445-20131203/25011_1 /TAXON_ID=36898 /ORGANISM="Pyramimonas sp., Strain CCMP2087" /LENGTH=438 /DNA_ID=CAMNT_0043885967 /DNA_START=113 /DNA_END=1429 /DNA_ORIENTATION=+